LPDWQLPIQVAEVQMAVQLTRLLSGKQIRKIMKNWILGNKLYAIGAFAGGIAGFLYWKYIGCLTGSCAITSKPVNSSLYFALLGALFFGLFKKNKKREQ
jgi:hypothetical protein